MKLECARRSDRKSGSPKTVTPWPPFGFCWVPRDTVWINSRPCSRAHRCAVQGRTTRNRAFSPRRVLDATQHCAGQVPAHLRPPSAHTELQRVTPLAGRSGLRPGVPCAAPPQRGLELVVMRTNRYYFPPGISGPPPTEPMSRSTLSTPSDWRSRAEEC